MKGTFKVNRSIWTDPTFKSEPYSEREAFMWLTSEASYLPREKNVDGKIHALQRGQDAVSTRFAAEAWNWSKSRVGRYLKRLQARNLIQLETGTGVTIVTILNYDEIQLKPKECGTAAGQRRDTDGTNYNEGIMQEGKREIPPSKPSSKLQGSRLPSDWILPPAWRDWAIDEGLEPGLVDNIGEKFRLHHIDGPGKGHRKPCWETAWKTWVLNDFKHPKNQEAGRSDGRENFSILFDRKLAELDISEDGLRADGSNPFPN